MMSSLRDLPTEERPRMGQLINETKTLLSELFNLKDEELKSVELEKKLSAETIDVTLPGINVPSGSTHLLKNVIEDFEQFFIGLGYEVKEGRRLSLITTTSKCLILGKIILLERCMIRFILTKINYLEVIHHQFKLELC